MPEERSYDSECRNALLLYIIIIHNCRTIVGIYLPITNNITLAKLGQNAIPLTRISIFQVLIMAFLIKPSFNWLKRRRGMLHIRFLDILPRTVIRWIYAPPKT